jgi:hypothetical protein
MTKQLEVGKTYTSENGMDWLCIAVDGDIAHMRYDDMKDSVAYSWRLDGTAIRLTEEHRIVFEPERGVVVLTSWGTLHQWLQDQDGDLSMVDDSHGKYRLTLPTLDGELATGTYTHPDGHEIKVEKL